MRSDSVGSTALSKIWEPGIWVVRGAVAVQLLFVPWRPARGSVDLGYRPIWNPPDERFIPSIDIGNLLVGLGVTLAVGAVWHLLRKHIDPPDTAAESSFSGPAVGSADAIVALAQARMPHLPLETQQCQWARAKVLLTLRGWHSSRVVDELLAVTDAARLSCQNALRLQDRQVLDSVAAQVILALLLVDAEFRNRFPPPRLELIDAVAEHAFEWSPRGSNEPVSSTG